VRDQAGLQLGIKKAFAQARLRDGLLNDPAQSKIVDVLQHLQDELSARRSLVQRLLGRWTGQLRGAPVVIPGVYLWGGVGRGKTFLMDLFYSTLPTARKRRVHFHRMMNSIHVQLKTLVDVEDPVDKVAAEIARNTSVLCFDEFFVSDIGDAMILGRLLAGLFQRGVTLVATSNSAPADLYPDGLQRERFLPAIAQLETHTRVIHCDEGPDYRLRLLQRAGTFLTPADAAAETRLQQFFRDSAAHLPSDAAVEILGRPVRTRGCAGNVAWFEFSDLCASPRSSTDYIEIARRFQTIIVSGIPRLTAGQDDAARRLISMVDEFYDRRVKLMVSADAAIDSLYQGNKLAFEFRRTVSRLTEMQSVDYLHTAHRG
jgi:cell division protein ZapE